MKRSLAKQTALSGYTSRWPAVFSPTSIQAKRTQASKQTQKQTPPQAQARWLHRSSGHGVVRGAVSSSVSAACACVGQRRSFMSLFQGRPRPRKNVELEPGWETLLLWTSRTARNEQPPPRKDVVRGWTDLVQYKHRYRIPLNSTQALRLHEALKYLLAGGHGENNHHPHHRRNNSSSQNAGERDVTLLDLEMARDVLLLPMTLGADSVDAHLHLARTLYREITQQRKLLHYDESQLYLDAAPAFPPPDSTQPAAPPSSTPPTQNSSQSPAAPPVFRGQLLAPSDDDFHKYIRALCLYGGSLQAKARVHERWKVLTMTDNRLYYGSEKPWLYLLQGLAREKRDSELKREAAYLLDDLRLPFTNELQDILVGYYADTNQFEEVQYWFERPLDPPHHHETTENSLAKVRHPSPCVLAKVLQFCLQSGPDRLAWAQHVFQPILDANPSKEHWDVTFQWAVLALGKNVDDLRHMFSIMVRNNAHQPQKRPDIHTINGLLEGLAQTKRPLPLAQEVVALAEEEMKLQPTSRTYVHLLHACLSVGDWEAAREAYISLAKTDMGTNQEASTSTDFTTDGSPDAEGHLVSRVVNRYLSLLCAQESQRNGSCSSFRGESKKKKPKKTDTTHGAGDLGQDDVPPKSSAWMMMERLLRDIETHDHITLEPDTVVALCILYLKSQKRDQVWDTLASNAFQYSAAQRGAIRNGFVQYILDLGADLAAARAAAAAAAAAQEAPQPRQPRRQEEHFPESGPSPYDDGDDLEARGFRGGSEHPSVDPVVAQRISKQAWEAYDLLRQYFPEMDRDRRLQILESFFYDHRRADIAVRVFQDMRDSPLPQLQPDAEVYTRVFVALGRESPDPLVLQTVYTAMKVDTGLGSPDTRLRNALMLALGACGFLSRALDVWRQISVSREGPSYASFEIVFWVCERHPNGDATARKIWANMQRMQLDIPPRVAAAYVAALAGSGHVDDVMAFLRGMADAATSPAPGQGVVDSCYVGYPPDAYTLACVYNALPGQELQAQMEAWILASSPWRHLWESLLLTGRHADPNGLYRFPVDRRVDP